MWQEEKRRQAEIMDTDFRKKMRESESSGRSDILTQTGRGDMAGGYYQFTPDRLKDYSKATGEKVTMDAFIADPDLQGRVMDWHEQDILDYALNNGLDQYIGQEVGGVMIDPSALVGMAHLGGRLGMREFIESGGEYNPSDRFGTKISDYGQKFSGLDLYGLTPTRPMPRNESAVSMQQGVSLRPKARPQSLLDMF